MLIQLMTGGKIDLAVMQKKYAISKRTCQRDLASVRDALTESQIGRVVEKDGGYQLVLKDVGDKFDLALITSHVLLGSRALTVPELAATLKFLAAGLAPEAQTALHHQLTMARGSYTTLSRPQPLLERLHAVTDCIAQNQKIRFTYQSSQANEPAPLIHHAQPVAVFFEAHYFYVAMLSEERHGYWLYRLDRIVTILERQKGQKLDYARRFSLQDHRQQAYLLDSGSLTRIEFIYRYYEQTVLDYFPTARVLKTNPDGSHVIEAYVKVDGAMLWLMSQGAAVQVLSPVSLVDRMKAALSAARDQYQ